MNPIRRDVPLLTPRVTRVVRGVANLWLWPRSPRGLQRPSALGAAPVALLVGAARSGPSASVITGGNGPTSTPAIRAVILNVSTFVEITAAIEAARSCGRLHVPCGQEARNTFRQLSGLSLLPRERRALRRIPRRSHQSL